MHRVTAKRQKLLQVAATLLITGIIAPALGEWLGRSEPATAGRGTKRGISAEIAGHGVAVQNAAKLGFCACSAACT